MKPVKTVMIGVGNISGIYLKNLAETFHGVELVGVCDLVRSRAEAAQEKYGVKIYDTMYDAFKDPEVELILNLTRPYEHYGVSKAALEAGKNVYSEKPLAASLEEGIELRDLAVKKGLFLGGAPDTFLGGGIQTCRKLIEDGAIGKPVGASAYILSHGMENWHPDPDFFFKWGGGPVFDMGPYYVTAMVNLLGCVDSVLAMSTRGNETRTITSPFHFGETINVEVDTHIESVLHFESGVIGHLVASWDAYGLKGDRIEINGTEGTIIVPDPNGFGGPVKLFRPEDGEMKEVPLMFPYKENSRALGLADMAKAMQTGRKFRANCGQTFHVLEVMEGILTSGKSHKEVKIESRFEKSAPMLIHNKPGVLEE